MAGTGIGTFNDRLRDAVRGGGPFDEDPRIQGFASGLFTDPNGAPRSTARRGRAARPAAALPGPDQGRADRQPARLPVRRPHRADGHRRAGRLQRRSRPATPPTRRRRSPTSRRTTTRRSSTRWPTSCPRRTSMADRVRMQTARAGDDGARPGRRRSGTRAATCCAASRWTATATTPATGSTCSTGPHRANGFGRGLPPRPDNEAKWAFMRPLLGRPRAASRRRRTSARRARAPRSCWRSGAASPLFHLGTAARVQQKVRFPSGGPAQTPGRHRDGDRRHRRRDVDPQRQGLVVVFNASAEATTQTVPGHGRPAVRAAPGAGRRARPGGQAAVVRPAAGHVHRAGAGRSRCSSSASVPVRSLLPPDAAQARTSRRSPVALRLGSPPSSALRCTHLNDAGRQGTSDSGHWPGTAVSGVASVAGARGPWGPERAAARGWAGCASRPAAR